METKDRNLLISACILGIAVFLPRSIILYLLGFILGPIVFLIPPIAFIVLSLPLLHNRVSFRKYELLVPIILSGFSATWFFLGWPYALKYQGVRYFVLTATGSFLLFAGLCILFFAGSKHPTFVKRWAYNWTLCYWSMSWAFAFMGEAHM